VDNIKVHLFDAATKAWQKKGAGELKVIQFQDIVAIRKTLKALSSLLIYET